MLALFLAFSMTIGMLPGNMALANEGEGSSPTQTILAVQGSGTITDDDTLSELAYTDTAFIEASADGAPSGSVAAAWNKDNLYLGITSKSADSVKIGLGNKTLEVPSLTNGVAEVVIPWSETGIVLWRYDQMIEGLSVTLTDSNSVSSTMTAKVQLTTFTATDVNLDKSLTKYHATKWMTASADQLVIENDEVQSNDTATALGQNVNSNQVDHSKNILLTQTLKIDKMPVSDGKVAPGSNTAPVNNTYYFWLCDSAVAATGNGVWCNVYLASDNILHLKVIQKAEEGKKTSEGIPVDVSLGKKLGDTFQIALLWNADNSAVVYVDGKPLCTVADATINETSGWGKKAVRFAYRASSTNADDNAKITISDAVLSTTDVAPTPDILDKTKVLTMDLSEVTTNLILPVTYADAVFGNVGLTWKSSDSSVLEISAAKGIVHRGEIDKTVQLSLVINGETLWSIDVTVKAAVSQTLLAVQAGEMDPGDNTLSELVYTDTAFVEASEEGAPSGSVAAAWDKDNLYLGITTKNTTSVKINLGSKEVNATSLKDGVAEVTIPWNDAGVTLTDYDQLVNGLKITLVNSGVSSEMKADVRLTTLEATDVNFTKTEYPIQGKTSDFVKTGTTTCLEDSIEWKTSTANTTHQVIVRNDRRMDHSKNILLTQTLQFNKLPVGTGERRDNTKATDATYYFWMVDSAVANSGEAIWCNIFCADDETDDNLYLRVNLYAGNDTSKTGEAVALGKKLGDKFQLSFLWNADDSAVVYVDGKEVCTIADATNKAAGGWANNSFRFAYNGDGNDVSIVLSDVVISTAEVDKSKLADITQTAVLGNVNLTAVETDLTLPGIYEHPIFGSIPLTWSSSNENVLKSDGTVIRPMGDSETVQLSLAAGGKTLWTVNVTVLGAKTIYASAEDKITVDGILENAYTYFETIKASNTGAPSGKVSAVYNKNGLYVGVKYENASTLIVNVNGKTVTVPLDGSAYTGIGSVSVGSDVVELCLPWTDLGVTLTDYYHKIPGYQATLIGTDTVGTGDGDLVLSSWTKNNAVVPNAMTEWGTTQTNKDNITSTTTSANWKTTTTGVSAFYKTNYSFVDHSKDMILTQTLNFTTLPVSAGKFSSDSEAQDCYYFWVSDKKSDNGTGIFGNIYRADETGNLYLRIYDGKTNKDTSPRIPLGKKLNDTFTLAIRWNADDSAVIYVDGEAIYSLKNATDVRTNSLGAKCIQMRYNATAADKMAEFTVSDISVAVVNYNTITDEIKAAAESGSLLNNLDLTMVQANLSLPDVYESAYLGDMDLTWSSSDTDVLANNGTVTRPDGDQSQNVTLTLSVKGNQLWNTTVTILPKEQTLTAACADKIVVDGVLNEKYYTHYDTIKAPATGAPSGKVSTVYNKNGVYLGVKYTDATTVEISLNGKTITVNLTNDTYSGIDGAEVKVAAETGIAEVFLPWSALGVTPTDYYQEITGYQVLLKDATNTTSALLPAAGKLQITSEQVNEVKPNTMKTTGNVADISATATEAFWDVQAQGVSVFYQDGYAFVDHSKDMLVSQTLCFEDLPVSVGKFSGDLQANDSYYFWISDYADKGESDNIKDNNGTAMMGNIYRANDAGDLYLRIYDGKTDQETSERISLGKKLGDTFNLAIRWNADDSAVVYVDSVEIARVNNATVVKTQYMGNKTIQMRYYNVTEGNTAKFTVSDVHVSVALVDSVADEINAGVLLPGVDLNNVQTDLNLPAAYVSPYLPDIALTWTSDNNAVIDSATGNVTRPEVGGQKVEVKLTAKADIGGEKTWEIKAIVAPKLPEAQGPFPVSPTIITTAYTAESITVDGKLSEEGWQLNTRVLDAQGMLQGKFGAQWTKDILYLGAKVRDNNTLKLTINNKTVTIDVATLTSNGDFSIANGNIAKKDDYIEMAIPMSALGLSVDGYNTIVPITVDLDGDSFSGNLKLTSIDWFAADNEYRPIPAPTKGSAKIGVDAPVAGYQGYEQVTDGWRMYDLYNPHGQNPTKIRTYVIYIKDALYEPLGDRSQTIFVEFDFLADALPVYDVNSDTGLTNHFASYGMSWFVADDDDAAKFANTYSMGILNTEKGLALVAMPGTGVPTILYLNRQVGDLLRIGTAWKTNGDVVVYLDGEEFAVLEGLEALRGSFGDKSVAFNLVRNATAATSTADNMDVTITNVAMGHSYDNGVLDGLTFAAIAGRNLSENEIIFDLSLPDKLTDPLLGTQWDVTWTSSDNGVIDPADGKVTRPANGQVKVTLTATLADQSTKSFELVVLSAGSSSDNVFVLSNDRDPASGKGAVTNTYRFTLDADNSSVIYDLKQRQKVNVVALKDDDESARLNEEVLTLWVSDDNVTYTRVEDFKLLHKGDTWYLYDFEAEGRYVKVHCTHYDGEEADFAGSVAEMIRAYYEDVFGDGDSDFAVEKTYTLTNDTGKERYDYAWSIAKSDLGITGADASIRVFVGEELLYHYVDGDHVIVRVPYVDKSASVTLTVLSGNDAAMDISNKEYVHEVTYGTREAWTIFDGAHWILTLPAGTKFPNGDSVTVETMLILGGKDKMIWRAFSTDGGRSWSDKEMIECTKEYITEGGGMIFDSVTGRIMFHGHKAVKFSENDMTQSDCKTNLIYSDDGGKNWQTLATVQSDATYLISYTDGIQLSCYDGEGPNVDFVFPLGAQNNNYGAFCGRVAYTTDGGKTWQTSADQITYLEGKAKEDGVSECTIQEREDGVLVLIGRNEASGTDVFVEAYSYDHGVTWTDIGLSSVYTVNTQPIMFKYDGLPLLTWGGKNMLGDDTQIRTPYTVGVSYDGMESFDNLQDLYVKYSLQGLTYFNLNRVTNQSIQMTEDDTFVTVWWNSSKGWVESNTVFMYVEDFHDYFYRTKGAYDSFEHGTVKYEGWEASVGTATLADEKASDGKYSMKLVNAVAGRSIPYIQEGVISMDLYVDSTSDFTVELQSAFSNSYGKGAPVGFEVNGYDITFLGADTVSSLKLKDGWNTVTFALDLDGTGALARSNTASATLSVNGGEAVAMPINLAIGDYVTWITVMNVGTTYVDEILVVDEQDAMDKEAYEEAKEEAEKEAAANQAAADAVIAKIDAIGTVTLNSEKAIKEARSAYDALTDAQKDLVTNYAKLVAAEKKLAELKEAQNKPGDGGTGNGGTGDSGSGNSGSGNQSSGNQPSGNTGNQATNAPTGDNANFTLPLMGILMSMIIMAGAFEVSKKKKNI